MTERKLTIEEANRIADGLVTVSTDPVDAELWRVEGDGLVEAHETMTETDWRRMLQGYTEKLTPPAKPSATPQDRACRRVQADIASLADWIECELEKFDHDDVAWADVNTLEFVREHLIETLERFSDVSRLEIQRSLDELHDAPDDEMPAPGQRMPDGSFPERNCTM